MIHETHGGRVDIDQDFVAGRLRLFDLADAQIFRASERAAEHCSHRGTPASRGGYPVERQETEISAS
jgi:hypothetical protein